MAIEPLNADVARELRRQRDLRAGDPRSACSKASTAAGGVDVALHEMATQPRVRGERALEIHRRAGPAARRDLCVAAFRASRSKASASLVDAR